MNDLERKIDDIKGFIESAFGDIDDLLDKKFKEIASELNDLADDLKEDN